MDNTLLFLKAQIRAFHPDWTDAQVEMEAIKINSAQHSIEDDDEECLYCGS